MDEININVEELKRKLLTNVKLYVTKYSKQQQFVENNSTKLPFQEIVAISPFSTLPFFYAALKAIRMDFPGLRTAQIARMQELMRTGHGNNNFNLAVYLEIGAISYETLISIVGVTERHMEETVGLSEAEYQSALVFIEEALFEIEQISY